MPKVLIIDDDLAVREAFARTMRHAGFEVATVENGVAALTRLATEQFDALICDYKMPELGGHGFYEQLEEQLPHLARRVIFVTAYAEDPRIRNFLTQTGQPVMDKPVDIDLLVAEVKNLIARNSRPSSPGQAL